MVVVFILVCWVHSCAHCGSPVDLGSLCSLERALEVVGLIRSRPGGRRVHSCSLGSFGRARRVLGFIQVRWVHSCAFQWWSGSFWFIAFTRARHWVHSCVPSRSLVLFERELRPKSSYGFVGYIQARSGAYSGSLGSFWRVLEVVGLILIRWVYLGAPLGTSRSFLFVGRRALSVVGFVEFVRSRPWG